MPEALETLRAIYAQHHDRKAFEALIEILEKQDAWEDLEALYHERVQAGDRRYIERLGHAICAQEDRVEEGQRWLLAAVEEGRDESLALMNLGASSKRLGHSEEAIAYFERALKLGDERALMELADLLAGSPRDREVDRLLRRAIDNGHKSAPAYLARRQWARGELDELETLYRLAIERHHGPGPTAELGCVLRMHRPTRREEAGELVDMALDQAITWRVLRSVARLDTITPEISIWLLGRTLRKARELKTDHPCASDEFRDKVLAELLDLLGAEERFGEAEEVLSSVSIANAGTQVVKSAARLMEIQGRWSEVERIYRERIDAGDRSYLERLGHAIASQEGRDADAEPVFSAAVSEDRDAALALLNLGELANAIAGNKTRSSSSNARYALVSYERSTRWLAYLRIARAITRPMRSIVARLQLATPRRLPTWRDDSGNAGGSTSWRICTSWPSSVDMGRRQRWSSPAFYTASNLIASWKPSN